MNVLFIDQFGEIGGAQLCLLDLIPAVVKRGWHAFAAVPSEGPFAGRLRDAGVSVFPLEPGSYTASRKRLVDAVRFIGSVRRIAVEINRMCGEHAIDLIHVNGPRLLPAVALGSCPAPVLFHAHSYISQPAARRFAGWAIRRRKATVVAVSRFVAAQFAGQPHIIPSGVPDLRRNRASSRVPRIGVLGRIAPEKGQALFVEAARLLPECRFIVCGSPSIADPAYEREVRIRAQGLAIEFLGWRDDIGDVLAQLDVLAVPSTGEEGLGRVVIEAFSAGVPVVAFASGGIPELVEDGVTGFLVSSRTAEALAAKLQEALQSPERLTLVARNARAAWESNYTLDLYQHRMVRVMADAAECGPGARPRVQVPQRRTTEPGSQSAL